jgi:hypothetical protein
MNWLGDYLYYVFGIQGTGPWYSFWSGPGADISELAIFGGVLAAWHKHRCHVSGCYRLARHRVAGTLYVVCRRHHPDDSPSHAAVLAEHQAVQERDSHD